MDYVFISDEQRQIAKDNGIKIGTLMSRVQVLRWSIERAITEKPIKPQMKNRKYPDWVYENLEKNGIKRDTFRYRVNRCGWSLERACTTLPRINGRNRKYPDWVYEKLKENSISLGTFGVRRTQYHWSVERACTTPINTKHRRKNKS